MRKAWNKIGTLFEEEEEEMVVVGRFMFWGGYSTCVNL